MNLRLDLSTHEDAPGAKTSQARVGYVEGVIGGPARVASLAALFPNVRFESVGAVWPDRAITGLAALIVGAGADEVEKALKALAAAPSGPPVIVALRDADVTTTRRLMHGGAADILPAPVSEAALALSLERLLASSQAQAASAPEGKVICLLKAGGGVGATALGTQLAVILARRGGAGGVCFADLDLQFGQGALYFDLGDAMTLTDILGGGGPLEEAALTLALARHPGGARLLAAPRELAPLETLSPQDIDGLLTALRRDFAITLIDLPTVWTAWTNRALQLCDRIVLITNLSVPHINLVQRQLGVMAAQHLDGVPLTLVCNRVGADQRALVPLKVAEKALGRAFDVVIPEDRKLMNDAVAQGCELAAIRRGSKLEKAIDALAGVIDPVAATAPVATRGWRWP